MTAFMARDKSWPAVVDPGQATDYFAVAGQRPRFDAQQSQWHAGNAWWCSEISRTIYRRSDRQEWFAKVGLREVQFFDKRSTQAALLVAADAAAPHAVLVFRGTNNLRDWYTNLRVAPQSWPAGGSVHAGFAAALQKVWPQVCDNLASLSLPTFVTGHSLGGALATLAATRVEFAAAYTFGAPRVGDAAFWRTLRCPVHRVVHDRDIVPTLPPSSLGYQQGGNLHQIAEHGHVLRNPSHEELAAVAASLRNRHMLMPPAALSDHAPINYSAVLLAANR
jgi:triacylglycerol lipase